MLPTWSNIKHPMAPYVARWLKILEVAEQAREDRFGQYAKEVMKFYDGDHNWMWKDEYASSGGGFLDKTAGANLPTFRMTVNKPFEAVALFGPALFHQYPQVLVTPTKMPEILPEALGIDTSTPEGMQQYQQQQYIDQVQDNIKTSRANIKQHYLNWLQVEGNKKRQAKNSITEAVVAGAGYLWVEMYQPDGSAIKYPRSTYVSWQDILKDPDAEYNDEVQWISRKCVHPVNVVEEKYGLPPGYLKGTMQSLASQSQPQAGKDKKSNKKYADSYDLMEYWEIYSKNGFGDLLKQSPDGEMKNVDFSALGKYVYLAVAKGIPFPLNVPAEVLAEGEEALIERTQWPIPFWTDSGLGNGWPFSELGFYEKPKSVWPIPLIKPAIGELRFVNWCMSFLADKVAQSATTYVVTAAKAGASIQEQLSGDGSPFTHLEIKDMLGSKITDVVSFLDAPGFSLDIWRMVSEVMDMIDKRTGLTELLYGLTGTQIRSATEFKGRNENVAIRPDEMASRVEDWMSETAMKEMEAAVWMCDAQDVLPVLGEAGTKVWMEQIKTQDFDSVVRDFDYRIEAGSARKPNKATKAAQLNEFGQSFQQVFLQALNMGIVAPYNAYVKEVAKVLDLEANSFMIELPEPEEKGPSEEEIKAQMKQFEDAMELQHDQEAHDQEIDQSKETHNVDLDFLKRGNALRLGASRNNGNSNS